jgi:gas vesicle protein
MGFASAIGNFISAIGVFGAMLRDVLGGMIPTLSTSLNIVSDIIKSATPVFGLLLSLLRPILWTINMLLKGILGFANAIDSVLSPIISILTLGLIDMTGVVKSLTSAVILLGVALMAINLKSKPGGKGKAISGKLLDVGGKGLKSGAKAGGRGLMSVGRSAVSLGGKAAAKFGATGGAAGGGAAGAATAATALGGLAIIGGSAYGGSKVGGFVSDKLFNDDSIMSKTGGAAAGAVSGGATGMAIGAGIGSLFGGVGAAPGAAIGAVVGAVFGGISGWVNAGKEKKAARKAAEDILKNFGTELDSAINDGDTQGIADAATKMNTELIKLASSSKYGSKEVQKRQKEIKAELKKAENAISNFSNFESFFGDPDNLTKELNKQGLGIDSVKNGVINIFEVMRKGGHDVSATWSTVMGEFNQKLISARLAMFDLPLQTIEMQERVNAAQQKLLEGDASEQSVISFLKEAYQYSLSLAQGDATKAIDHMQRTLEKSYGPGGSLERVADVVRAQAETLQIFDPQVLVDQLITSGKIASQGRAIESISGGAITAGAAEVQLQKLIQSGDAGTAAEVDSLMELYMKNMLSSDQLMAGLTNQAGLTAMVEQGRARQYDMTGRDSFNDAINAATGTSNYTPQANNSQNLTIGGIEINVSGFISDKETGERIAKLVTDAIDKRQNRAGTGGR